MSSNRITTSSFINSCFYFPYSSGARCQSSLPFSCPRFWSGPLSNHSDTQPVQKMWHTFDTVRPITFIPTAKDQFLFFLSFGLSSWFCIKIFSSWAYWTRLSHYLQLPPLLSISSSSFQLLKPYHPNELQLPSTNTETRKSPGSKIERFEASTVNDK